MRRNVLLAKAPVAVLSVAVLFPACKGGETPAGGGGGTAQPPTTAAPSATGPVAKVNGQDIGRDVFSRQMDRTKQRFAQAKREIPPALEVRLKENIIRKLVDDELIAQKAKAEQITLSDQEVDAKLNEHKTRFGSPEAFKSFLERTGQSEADLRDELKRTELRDRLFNKLAAVEEPAEAEVKEFYEKNLDRYKERESVNAIQVFWKSDPKDPADARKKLEARVKTASTELKKKGVDFKAQIAKYTDATPSPNGGDMGWITRGRQVKDIEDAMFDPKVKANDIVGPIASQFGFHIIKVVDRKPEKQRPIEEVSAAITTAIKARKKSEKTRDALAGLKKEAKVEILEPGVSLEPQPLPPPPGPGGMPPPGAPGSPIQLQAVPPPGQPAPAPAQPAAAQPAAAPAQPAPAQP
ncbi:MAG: peptidyl-prolyl cis-trans isomerase [Deltaproteobacteria bacterium]|nr:peptidyl-prolyl cis-trans isomerase [Deltaproteobacteria bacterium]